MCFRPADVAETVSCPNCGKDINSAMGTFPKECPWCEIDLLEAVEAFRAKNPGMAAPGMPAAPGAPRAPGAPGAPKPPGVGSAPGPSMPGIPKPGTPPPPKTP